MKSFVTVVVCVSLLQGIWLSFSIGQDADCTTFMDKATCCLPANNTCVYVKCTVSKTVVTGCYNKTEDASCDKPGDAVDTCDVANTTTPAVTSEANATTSAGNGEANATTSAGNGEANATTSAGNGKANATTPAGNGKANATTPAGNGSETTEAATTQAATMQAATTAGTGPGNGTTGASSAVNCSIFDSNQAECCAAGNSSACVFFNCTSAGNLTGTFCVAANTTLECANKNETASGNICAESPSGGENPTQAPSSGSESGGQKFDAASFIGGIVLCAGILAITYFGVKFYRSKQERNYESM